jgi:glucosamine--fructose-6-phosphate aminotransferase (isomerizing)
MAWTGPGHDSLSGAGRRRRGKTLALHDEIVDQPDAIARLLNSNMSPLEGAAAAIRDGSVKRVWIAARGTSDHAAIYAQYVLGVRHGLPVGLLSPSILTVYGRMPELAGDLVIGISQSGMSPDIVGVIAAASAQGARTLALTNDVDSNLGRSAELVMPLGVGVEFAVAATKTYTAELTVIALLSTIVGGRTEDMDEVCRIPELLSYALVRDAEIKQIAADQARHGLTRCIVIGRGYDYPTAREWALKLKELARVFADPYSSADFLHGPLALVEPEIPVLAVVHDGPAIDDQLILLQRLAVEFGAPLCVISDLAEARSYATWSVAIPTSIPDWLRPIVAIVPAQLHALRLTEAVGLDPNRPRAIRKVTHTR